MVLFENFNEIRNLCQKYGIKNYNIDSDGTIDVDGDVDLNDKQLTKLPVKFRNVGGHFWCENNELTALLGAPLRVDGDFSCDGNNLTTLLGSPQSVSGGFWCGYNKLTTLEGAPKSVGGGFYCPRNPFDVIRYMFPHSKEFYNANKEWDFFAGGNKIRKLRFKEALLDYDIQLPESIPGYEYI